MVRRPAGHRAARPACPRRSARCRTGRVPRSVTRPRRRPGAASSRRRARGRPPRSAGAWLLRVRRVQGEAAPRGEVGLAVGGQLVVPLLPHQLDQLGAHRDVDRLGARRAPRCCRCSTSPGRDRRGPSRAGRTRAMTTTSTSVPSPPVDPLEGPPDRQLPADVRLGLEEVPPGAQREAVQGAPLAAGEAGPVGEDAGAVDDPGLARPLLVLLGPVLGVVVLPRLRGELLDEASSPASRRPCRRSARRGCSTRRRRAGRRRCPGSRCRRCTSSSTSARSGRSGTPARRPRGRGTRPTRGESPGEPRARHTA